MPDADYTLLSLPENLYGSQSERGMKTREILAAVLHPAAARGLDPAAFLEVFLNNSKNASFLFS